MTTCTWIARADIGLYAVTSPIGPSAHAAVFTLGVLVSHLEASTRTAAAESSLREALAAAEAGWQEQVSHEPALRGLGSTVAAVVGSGGSVCVAHLGDCRVYQMRDGCFIRRTEDHTLGSERSNVIVRGIGMGSEPEVSLWDVRPTDTFLLTGGVHEVLDDGELLAMLLAAKRPSDAARAIAEQAVARGGQDYLTALAFRASEVLDREGAVRRAP